MNEKDLIPELHDLFKLTTYKHDLSDFDSQRFKYDIPNNRTWQGIIQHHNPVEPDTILLSVADHLAAGSARTSVESKGEPDFTIRKLWNPIEQLGDHRLTTENEIRDLLRFANKCQDGQEFLDRYNKILKRRAEDAHPGKNITSLYTHSLLTGKFYRLLKTTQIPGVIEIEFSGLTPEKIGAKLKEWESQRWQLSVTRCRISLPHRPYRARDLNILRELDTTLQRIQQDYPDNVFYNGQNELILFYFQNEQIKPIIDTLMKLRCSLEMVGERRCLFEITDPSWIAERGKRQMVERELPETITPPICSVCQMAAAEKHWPLDYIFDKKDICPKCREILSNIPVSQAIEELCATDREKLADISDELATEDLCSDCFNLRITGVKMMKLKNWAEGGGTEVAWVKTTLNIDNLVNALKKLLRDYQIQVGVADAQAQPEIRFPLIAEFLEDYETFLNTLRTEFCNQFGQENVETITRDILCVRLDKVRQTFSLLKIYYQVFMKFLPAFAEIKQNPVSLGIVLASSKYPFFEVWDLLSQVESEVEVIMPDKGVMRCRVNILDCLIKTEEEDYRFHKSALENLAQVARISEALARLKAGTRTDSDSQTYAHFHHLGLDFQSLLTFAKLLEG